MKFLPGCLSTLLNTSYPNFEIIVVDNSSKDGSVDLIKRSFGSSPRLTVQQNERNFGFAEGNNIGARLANGKYIVFLNVDTETDSEWLTKLVEVMESDESIGAAQSKLLLFDHSTIDSTGDFIDSYGYGFQRGHGEEDRGQYNKTDEIFSARGAAMIVRKRILMKVGYFDPTFFMLCEDIDLSWRIRLTGHKVMFVPQSVVYHAGSGIRKAYQSSVQSYYYNNRNILITLIKNYDLKGLMIYGTVNVLLQLTRSFLSLPFTSNRSCNLSRLKGMIWIIIHFKTIWRNRLRVQYILRKVSDKEIKRCVIKKNLAILEIVWHLLYKNKVRYERFITSCLLIRCHRRSHKT